MRERGDLFARAAAAPAAGESVSITVGGEELVFHGGRGLYWPRRQTLVVADLHLGKTGHFRANGVPVPPGAQDGDLARLAQLVRRFGVRELVVVGDLFHAGANYELWEFLPWRDQFPELVCTLVPGNHDRLPLETYSRLGIAVGDIALARPPFCFTHGDRTSMAEAEHLKGQSILVTGHVHPRARFFGPAKQQLRLPCFVVREREILLPAFGTFTGGTTFVPSPGERIIGLIEGRVVDLVL